MTPSQKISRFFEDPVRDRGFGYFKNDKINILVCGEHIVIAEAYGSRKYDIEVRNPRKNQLQIHCSCPYFKEWNSPCKHLWAAILTAGHQGWNPALPDYRNITMEPIADAEEPEDEDGNDGDDFDLKVLESDPLRRFKLNDYNSLLNTRFQEKLLPFGRPNPLISPTPAQPPKRKSGWKEILAGINASSESFQQDYEKKEMRLIYCLDVSRSLVNDGVTIEMQLSERKKNGDWGAPGLKRIGSDLVNKMHDKTDRDILAILLGAQREDAQFSYPYAYHHGVSSFILPSALQQTIIERICATGRARIKPVDGYGEHIPLRWDGSGPWEFRLHVSQNQKSYRMGGLLSRAGENMPLAKPHLLLAGGLLFWEDLVAPLNDHGAFHWMLNLRDINWIDVPLKDGPLLLEEFYAMSLTPPIELPPELQVETVAAEPGRQLVITTEELGYLSRSRLIAKATFNYGGLLVPASDSREKVFHRESNRLIQRNLQIEQGALDELLETGFSFFSQYKRNGRDDKRLWILPGKLPKAVRFLVNKGWRVEAEGKLYRQAGPFDMNVTSGIDWFELHGEMHFDGNMVSLPQLLAAVKKSQFLVELDDGTFGILPEKWIEQYAPLAELGDARRDHLEFGKNQAGLLDALLASRPEIQVDETFARIRRKLKDFDGLKPREPSGRFTGALRSYQKDGLGWLYFLQEFGMGGCLADDMGLGKTVQLLALLEAERISGPSGKTKKPSIIVVPRSLLFNWHEEAEKFTPDLKVLVYSGLERKNLQTEFNRADLILMTYGTLRRDIAELSGMEFHYAVLDEAQAIKNPKSQMAKAARLIWSKHRMALSGTPIENRLGDLWSIFEFLNPGMLGKSAAFNLIKDEESRKILARALRPFILRRTKSQVAGELPEKTEQIIYCELDKAQQAKYDELKKYYQASLLDVRKAGNPGRFKIQILEALLRLRQAACHPGLIDKSRVHESSAKLESLWEQLSEILSEGHKALVFSQFTSFLSIFRQRLDEQDVPYLYLDGQTRDRRSLVHTFQKDEKYRLFLISLKAGGLGLNLTAAEYVFILDPWWNPAVETQAIDRAHRIGQTKSVFAYKIISRGTVEEKVLELQKSKRDLAESIIAEDNNLLKNLTREDLSFLLS